MIAYDTDLSDNLVKPEYPPPCKQDFINYYFDNIIKHFCIIFAGSVKDEKHVTKLKNELKKQNIYATSYVSSAHKNTREVMDILDKYNAEKTECVLWKKRKIVWITVAGRSNALSGVVSANTPYPVIACPPFADKMDMTVNINSTLQCPSNVPVMTVLEPSNVALCVKKMFAL